MNKTNKEERKIELGQGVELYGQKYEIVGLSRMIYDEECEGEPEWKITKEIQEVAIADIHEGISYQKPSWISIKDLLTTRKGKE